jgi:hypothetical protein
MTRINVAPVQELHYKHLVAEYRELPRCFSLVRKGQGKRKWNIPKEYVLGSGHVSFFYDKLGWLVQRYEALVEEMRVRGYNPTPIPSNQLVDGISEHYRGMWTPTAEAVKLNRQRINERLEGMKI